MFLKQNQWKKKEQKLTMCWNLVITDTSEKNGCGPHMTHPLMAYTTQSGRRGLGDSAHVFLFSIGSYLALQINAPSRLHVLACLCSELSENCIEQLLYFPLKQSLSHVLLVILDCLDAESLSKLDWTLNFMWYSIFSMEVLATSNSW